MVGTLGDSALAAVGLGGFWNAIDRSRFFMITMLAMHLVNVILNYILIFGKLGLPALGVRGAGDSLRVMTVSIFFQWGIFLPLASFLNPLWGYGLLGVWLLQVGYRGIQTGLFTVFWFGNRWTKIKL